MTNNKLTNDEIRINGSRSKLGIWIWEFFSHFGTVIRIFAIGILVWSFGFTAVATVDLSEIGVGARSLSLGNAYVGGINDASSIFTNPAGLTLTSGLNTLSMSGSLLSDVNYLLLGAANDFPIGKVGVGYVSASVPSIPITTLEGSGASLGATQTGLTDYGSSMIFLSYATKLSRILKGRKGDNISIGMNLKYFFQGFSGDATLLQNAGMQGATGVGMDADLGVLVQANSWSRYGLSFSNFLPTTLGGKFTWQTNNEVDGISLAIRSGGSFNLLGQKGLFFSEDQRLDLLVDYESAGENNRPAVWHNGLEYWPLELLSLRVGMDQAPKASEVGIGVDNNFSAGVGIDFRGFTFDYAYHQFGELTQNTTHFFSIGFKELIDENRKQRNENMRGILPVPQVVPKPKLKAFSDISENYWARKPVEYLATLGVMGGYPDGTFLPEKPLTRGELAAILVKAKGFEAKPVSKTNFRDVSAQDWLAPYIDMVVKRKYMGGFPDKTFRPHKKVTRAEAAVIFSKFAGLYVKSKVSEKVFPDVAKQHWASPSIAAAKEAGFFEFLSGRNYEPSNYLTRSEAAEILSKTAFLKSKIIKLISGEV